MELVRVEDLTKTYGEKESKVYALDGVSMTVEKGEFLGIVGASGSGKSTLLHMIGGVDRPTSGRVIINDRDIFSLNEEALAVFRRREVGLIYQFYNLIPILSVEENICLPLLLDNRKLDQEELDRLLEIFGLSDRRTHLPGQLSGGQQQRTSIARALISRPSIILADEPTGNLDSKATTDIMDILLRLNRDLGQTIIMITHNLDLANRTDRILQLEDGRIVGRR